jgi:hypothetical protein
MSHLLLRVLLLTQFLATGPGFAWLDKPSRAPSRALGVDCPSTRPRGLLGLSGRPLTLTEMVNELERGCLALDGVRFRPGQDTIESLSPAQLALVARALGLARGDYRVAVPPEASPGSPPDTLQARRRGTRLRDELVHYGASSQRLLEDPGWPASPLVVTPGAAVPMLVRVPET